MDNQKVVKEYETIFITKPELTEEELNAVIEKFKSVIEKDGEVLEVNIWGKKKLAYEINYIKEGIYVLVKFKSSTELPKELERIYKIDENIIRDIIVSVA